MFLKILCALVTCPLQGLMEDQIAEAKTITASSLLQGSCISRGWDSLHAIPFVPYHLPASSIFFLVSRRTRSLLLSLELSFVRSARLERSQLLRRLTIRMAHRSHGGDVEIIVIFNRIYG